MTKDAEVEEFLKRVEDLDGKINKPPIVKKKPQHLSTTPIENDDTLDVNLVYKSAFNYEKSFGSKKPAGIIGLDKEDDRKFLVSEEDYKLLQKIKMEQQQQHLSERHHRHIEPVRHIIPDRHSKPIFHNEPIIVREESEDEAPPLPSRNRASSENVVKSTTSAPPLLPRRRYKDDITAKELDVVSDNVNSSNKIKEMSSISDKNKSRTPLPEKKTFLKSLEDNKLTTSNYKDQDKGPELKPTRDVDFLESVQLKSPPQSPSKMKTIEEKHFKLNSPKKDGFIVSVLSSEENSRSSLSEKPSNEGNFHLSGGLTTKAEKKKPGGGKQIEPEFQKIVLNKRTPPPVSKRKPSIPEALLKAQNLSKNTENKKSVAQSKESIDMLPKLNKKGPPVPQRKVSMPEALKKLESMKNKNSTTENVQKDNGEESEISDSEPESINNKLESVLKRANTSGQIGSKHIGHIPPRAATTGDLLSKKEPHTTQSLSHPNKSRSRGPKRKLPTKI
ncbi:Hypothetical protein J6898_02611 [Nakaseomyces glabratus]